MSVVRAALLLVLALAAFCAVYAWRNANLGLLRNGCIGDVGLPPDSGTVHFVVFPPHLVCRYTTKDGRVVERSQ